jgi:hypothetical protein
MALTFSSTIIVVKLLSDRREIDDLHRPPRSPCDDVADTPAPRSRCRPTGDIRPVGWRAPVEGGRRAEKAMDHKNITGPAVIDVELREPLLTA